MTCIDRLREAIVYSDWLAVYHTDDVTEMYGLFLRQCQDVIESCVPVKMVSLGPRDTDFITPLIKSLLKTRNKYRRSGRIEQANKLLAQERSRSLERLDSAAQRDCGMQSERILGRITGAAFTHFWLIQML